MSQESVLKQINRSGFPFQLRVEHDIRLTQDTHGWEVASREHPWSTPDNASSGFIDLVLQHNQFVTFRIVIECKRHRADDMKQLRWVFLIPDQTPITTTITSCFEVEGNKASSPESEYKEIRVWDNVHLLPASLQSEFCILYGDEPKRQPILESLAREVLDSIEGLAEEEVNIGKSAERLMGGSIHTRLFIFPVIVTNAQIAICRFDPSNIKVTEGTLDVGNVEISTAPFIRFRKSLATEFPQGAFYYLAAANKARERTVFVVNAESLPEFLTGWQMMPLQGRRYAVQELSY